MQRPLASLLERMSEWGEVKCESSKAVISDCGKYRYLLERRWNFEPESLTLTFIMLNPSTADAKKDDPTIRRCVGLAKEGNYGGIRILNLFAFRTPSPEKLLKAKDPVGPWNDHYLQHIQQTDYVLAAWGSGTKFTNRAHEVWKSLTMARIQLRCFGTNKDGSPKHPLYLPSGSYPFQFPRPRGW